MEALIWRQIDSVKSVSQSDCTLLRTRLCKCAVREMTTRLRVGTMLVSFGNRETSLVARGECSDHGNRLGIISTHRPWGAR